MKEMYKRIFRVLSLLILACTLIANKEAAYSDTKPNIYAGYAEVDITPPTGGLLWGYGSGTRSTGIMDSLKAKILYLECADTQIVVVSWDLCEFQSPWLRDQTMAMGIEKLLICNSHTHYGTDLTELDFPSSDSPWRQVVETRVLGAIRKARQDLFTAYFAAGEGEITLGYNRLKRDVDGKVTVVYSNPERIPIGPVDPSVGVIRITDEAGAYRGVLVNYACHPVVLGKRGMITAGYPGVMYRKIERQMGDGTFCMFMQAGGGDINPLIQSRTGTDEEDYEAVKKMGLFLAEEVMDVLQRMKGVSGKSSQLTYADEVLTVQRRWEPNETMRLGVTSLLINQDIGIVTLPGEPFHMFQLVLREKAGLPHVFLYGYCDDSYQDWPNWYLPDIVSAAHGGYGASNATIPAVGTGERLINTGLIQLYTLRGMLRPEPWEVKRGGP